MAFDDYSYLAFIGIIIFDVSALSFSILLWSKYRLSIISLVHSGFSHRNIRIKKIKKQKDEGTSDDKQYNAVKTGNLFVKKDTFLDILKNKSFSSSKFDEKMKGLSGSIDNFGLYEKISNDSIGSDEIPGSKRLSKVLQKYKNKNSWWTYFIYDVSRRIENNEAKLYLKFMGQNCRMLLICFASSIAINAFVFLIFLIRKEPYVFLSYTFQDILNCKTTTWALYVNTWVYSFVAYYFILKFRQNIEGNKQVTAILRPQLHTLMVSGFSKHTTDPSVIYEHFDSYFPSQVVSVHIVMNHSRRLLLEYKLENAKLQLSGLYDAVSAQPGTHVLNKPNETRQSSCENAFIDSDQLRKLKRSYSCHSLHEGLEKSESLKFRSFSCHNLNYVPSDDNDGKRSFSFDKEMCDHYGSMKNKFIKRMMTIKKLKNQIEEEKNKVNLSSRICFVSFADSNLVYHILRDKKILESMYKWHLSPAPHPKDIVWLNLSRTRMEILFRAAFINSIIILFYVCVTYFLAKLNIIRRYNGVKNTNEGVGQLINSSFWQGIIQSIVTLVINSAVHPNLIFFLSKYIGIWTHTNFQKYLLFEHIVFLFTSTIFVPLLASMIAIWRIFDGDVDLLSVELGRILINTSWKYVTTYVINATLLVPCNQLLQISPLFLRYFYQVVFNTDEGVPFFDLGYWYAYHLAVLTLVISFGLFIPYLLPLAALYFTLRFYVDRHNIAYNLWKFPFDNSGVISRTAIKSMLLSVSIMQFMMSGVFTQNKSLPGFLIAILYIAPVTTWLVMYGSYTDTIIQSMSTFYEIDLKPLTQKMIQIIQVCYMHPCDIKDLIEFKNTKK